MNIVSVGNFYGDTWDGSIADEIHIADALEELGHKVLRIDRKENLHFILHSTEGWDFFLFAQWDGYPSTLTFDGVTRPLMDALRYVHQTTELGKEPGELIRGPGPKMVYWAFDYQADGQEWHEQLVRGVDLYLSKRIADSKYPNWQWLSQDFSPAFLDKLWGAPAVKDIQVLFTGSYLPWADERNETLKTVDDKYSLQIYSINPTEWTNRGFKNVNGPVMDNGLPELYARARIILSIDHTIEAGYWSDRNAQIMCCGGRPLFRYVPLSETVFHDKVDYFHNTEDCINKIEAILHTQYEPWDTYRYAQDNLKVKNRVKDLLTIVGAIL